MNFEGVLTIVGGIGLALLIVVLNDRWKRGLPGIQDGPHRLRELNQHQGFFQKLGTTILLLVFGALIAPMTLVGLQLQKDPVLRVVFGSILEAIGVFYVVLLVYIWWRPGWMTRLYRSVESGLIQTACVFAGVILIGAAAAGIVALIRS